MNAWIALVGCVEDVLSVKGQNARANIELARVLQKLQVLGRTMRFLYLGEFWMQSIRVQNCNDLVYLYRMDTKSTLTSCTSSSTFCNFSCI